MGALEGAKDGDLVGRKVGLKEGLLVGSLEGYFVGPKDGTVEGSFEGGLVGPLLGVKDGTFVELVELRNYVFTNQKVFMKIQLCNDHLDAEAAIINVDTRYNQALLDANFIPLNYHRDKYLHSLLNFIVLRKCGKCNLQLCIDVCVNY